MRYIIGAVLILSIVIAVITLNSVYTDQFIDESISIARDALASHENGNTVYALQEAKHLYTFWEDNRIYLESIMTHSMLNDIFIAISDFISAIQSGNTDDINKASRLFNVMMNHLKRLEDFSLGNIL